MKTNMEKEPESKPRMFLSRGRPPKTVEINRNISVDFEDYKQVMEYLHQKLSLTAIETLTSQSITTLRAIRKYAVDNELIPKKRNQELNAKIGEIIRRREVELDELFAPSDPEPETKLEEVTQLTLELPGEESPEEKVYEDCEAPKTQTITIDFKGILITGEVSTITFKDDIIIVR